MVSAWAFIFGCILCLMFLGMIYGEQLSVIRVLEGRWFEPFPRSLGQLWNQLSLAVDLLVRFVMEHLSWVVATVSGTVGLFIVAFLMFSGMADDAAAKWGDLHIPLQAGGVIDSVPEIVAQPAVIPPESAEVDESEFVWQQPGGGYLVFRRPELDRPLPGPVRKPDLDLIPDADWALEDRSLDRPVMELTLIRSESRSMQIEDDAESIVRGKLIEWPLPQQIDRAVRSMRLDDWRMTVADRDRRDRFGDPLDSILRPGSSVSDGLMRESAPEDLLDLEARVRIVPGDTIAENQLRVEKTAPSESAGAELTVEISVLNLGDTSVRGLLVREFMPRGTKVRDARPQAVLRDDTLTWLLEDLEPFAEQTLRFTVLAAPLAGTASRRPRFESATEVSAAAAVGSRTLVRNRELPATRPSNPFPELDLLTPAERPADLPVRDTVPRPSLTPPTGERRFVPSSVASRPDVRLRIEEPLLPVQVGQTVEVNFVVENRGDAPAEGVGLRVVLDQGLRHHRVAEDEANREVVNQVRRIEPGQTKSVILRMRAVRPGEFLSRAEMIFAGEQLSRDLFRVVAEEKLDADPFGSTIR